MIRSNFRQLLAVLRSFPVFFGINLLFLLLAAGFLLLNEKGAMILYFNSGREEFWNAFFMYGTMLGEAYMYILGMIVLLFVSYRMVLAIPLLGLMVTLASFVLKKVFSHPRPGAYFTEMGRFEELSLIAGVKMYMGSNSFPSGHTMSAFALFTFLMLALEKRGGLWLEFIFAAMAIIVGISRIYLMHHFLEDVFLGAIVGMLIGGVWYYRVAKKLPVEGRLRL